MLNQIEIWRIRWPSNNLNLAATKKSFTHFKFMNRRVILLKQSVSLVNRKQTSVQNFFIHGCIYLFFSFPSISKM